MRFKVNLSSEYVWFDRVLCTGCGVVGVGGGGDAGHCQGEAGYCCAVCSGDTWRVGVMRWLCPEVMDKKVGGKDQWCWKSGALWIGVVAGGWHECVTHPVLYIRWEAWPSCEASTMPPAASAAARPVLPGYPKDPG